MYKVEEIYLQSRSLKNSDGFTFIEILVSMFAMSLLGIVLWSGFLNAQGLVRRAFRTASESIRTLQLDDALMLLASRVRIPYWESASGARSDSTTLRVPWLDGERTNILVLEKQDGRLAIRVEKSGDSTYLTTFSGQVNEVSDATTRSAIRIDLSSNVDGESLVLLAGFGSNPWPVGESR